MTLDLVLLPGDGIGPEVVEAGLRVLEALAADNDFEVCTTSLTVGGAAIDAYGTPLRNEDLERCKSADAVLLGAVGGPRWDNLPIATRPERGLLRLRSELALNINLRPVRWTEAGGNYSPLKPEVARDADIAFIRELIGGVYFGRPSHIRETPEGREAIDTAHYGEAQIRAVLEFAFALARTRRGKVTSVDKANVMNTSRLWREVAIEYGRQHADVELEHALVDSFAMSLMQDPRRYDVVVTENLFGDILTDLAGVIAGSLGVLPSASLRSGADGTHFGLYEPIHGSAPTIAGRGIANPAGAILSIALLLEWTLDRSDLAHTVRDAVATVMGQGVYTADLVAPGGPSVGTTEFTDAVIRTIRTKGGTREHRSVRHHVA